MRTRDGIRLDADVYYPDADGEFPVLLMRQPYGRSIASTVVYAHPTWYAAQGYIVVIQDTRGRGTSEGEFSLFGHEVEDGEDTVNWVSQLSRSTGVVGMYGFSYQGMTQLYAASAKPSALKAIAPAMVGYDLYHDWAYENGAFCYQQSLGWAIQLAAETARRKGDESAYKRLYAAARIPLQDPVNVRSLLLEELAPDSFYHDWIAHPTPDEYWQNLKPNLQDVDLPMLHVGGWFDIYLRGTMRLYREMAERTQPQHLYVGPWAHLPWSRRVGAIDFGAAANHDIDRIQIRWFDHFLKGKDTGLLDEPPVHCFEMFGDRWRSFPEYPTTNPQLLYLTSTGLASLSETEGQLVEQIPDRSLELLVHDPWRPVPALGGHATFPAGSFDRSSLDGRSDILTYTSEPLSADLHLAGEVVLEVDCVADAASFDLCAVLSDVHSIGIFNITQGYARFDLSSSPLRIPLQPTCARIAAGHALRLSLSAACSPAYAVNAGTGDAPRDSRLIEARVITLRIGGAGRSFLELPVAP
ncbi:CocE/NonD family hydrolase [Microcoleus sp. FACHB-1515]|nr:CocE/NonD family hydrolase [Microcoleus sp. FACHB-1515]